jgi:peptidoglycan/LPS O-acetylase OafA/YrhL
MSLTMSHTGGTPETSRSPRLRALDALRGVAILLVVTWHYFPQPSTPVHNRVFTWIRAANVLSWSGVDLFFVLSGFLICGILLDNRLSANYHRTFYIRRTFRIAPLYLVALALAATTVHWRASWKAFLAYVFFVQNFLVAATGTWGLPHLQATWSLAVEEQFYLLAPLIIRRVSSERLPWLLLACIAAAPVWRLAMWTLLPTSIAPYAAITLLPCRMDSLALGALIAWSVRSNRWRPMLSDNRLLAVLGGISAVFGIALPLARGWSMLSPYTSIAGISCLAMFYGVLLTKCLTPSADRLSGTVVGRPLAALGVGAFSIFLFNLSLRDGIGAIWEVRSGPASLLMYGLTLAAANAIVAFTAWTFIEAPLIRWSHRLTTSTRTT